MEKQQDFRKITSKTVEITVTII